MQALIATLDVTLYNSVSTLLTAGNPGIVIRRAYNGPEVHALLEGEAFSLVFFDSSMPGYGKEFSANGSAPRYPEANFYVLGGSIGLRLDSIPREPPTIGRPTVADSAHVKPPLANAVKAVESIQHQGKPNPMLTCRQVDVLRLVKEGKSTKEIARHLELAVPTVKTHLAALYRQLGVRNRVEAAMSQPTPLSHPSRSANSPQSAEPVRLGHLRAVG